MAVIIYLSTILVSNFSLIIYCLCNPKVCNKKNNILKIFIPFYNIIYVIKIIKEDIKNNKKMDKKI